MEDSDSTKNTSIAASSPSSDRTTTNTDTRDLFKESFKYYRRLEHDALQNIVRNRDRPDLNRNAGAEWSNQPSLHWEPRKSCNGALPKQARSFIGLKPVDTWNVCKLHFPEGLIFIRNPFTAEGQRYWISKCVLDFPNAPHITNIENLKRRTTSPRNPDESCIPDEDLRDADFYKKLRWVTFGYHHDWDTKIYSEEYKCEFPKDLALLTSYFALALGFKDFSAEAAIVNYYNLDSTLSGHQDRSEINQEAPLFSISFGQTAIFLIGGESKNVEPVPVVLESGDVVVMSGRSRLSYHGVPRITSSVATPWLSADSEFPQNLDDDLEDSSEQVPRKIRKLDDFCTCNLCAMAGGVDASEDSEIRSWNEFLAEYISTCRLNLNIRQVLYP